MKNKILVIDTNVCLDLFVFQDPRWTAILTGLKNLEIKAITTQNCRDEWIAVLKYPHLASRINTLSKIIEEFDSLIECKTFDRLSLLKLPICSDKDDQKFLELALDAKANFLITKDKALLKLNRKVSNLGLFAILTPEKFISSQIA